MTSLVTIFGFTVNIYAIILLVLGLIFILAFVSAQRQQGLDWTDVITHDGPDKRVSMTKILQMVGGVVGTWIVIQMTLGGSLTWDMFAIYLAYVASVEGYSKTLQMKYGSGSRSRYSASDDDDEPIPKIRKRARRSSIDDDEDEDTRPSGSAKTPD